MRGVALALLASALVWLDPGGHLGGFESRMLDARARHFATPSAHTQRIVILDIGEESIELLRPIYGRWPWPRSLHAEVVQYLAADGAAAIGFDLLFVEPVTRREVDQEDWQALAALARSTDIPEVRDELARRIEALQPGTADREFTRAVAQAGNVFQAAVLDPGRRAETPPAGAATRQRLAAAPSPGQDLRASGATAAMPPAADSEAGKAWQAILPFPELAQASRGIGHINMLPDADGIYRRYAPLLPLAGGQDAWPALGLAIAAWVKGVPPGSVRRTDDGLRVGDAVLPLDGTASARIRYQGGVVQRAADGRETFQSFYRHIPYEQVLQTIDLRASGRQAPLPEGAFRDRVVLVSAQAAGLSDLRATPFSAVTPGIEIHANIIDNLLAGCFLHAPPAWSMFLLTLALSVGAGMLAGRLRFRVGVPSLLALAGGYAGTAWAAYGAGWVLPLLPPLAAMALTHGGTLLARTVRAERDRRWLRAAFGHYLAPAVLAQVLQQPDTLRLGGTRRHMTVLFCDVAGFTTLSERLPPEEIGNLLNAHLDRMAQSVMHTGGTLDKFIGDAVMAEWNAPLTQPDHAARACDTALRMLEETAGQRAVWQAAGASLEIRIGINTGEMVVGNMGSHQVFDYTVIGNEVNTAARLEPLNKAFGTRILVAGATRRKAELHWPERFVFRRLGHVSLKGRAAALEIHELVCRSDAADETLRACLADFDLALEHYFARRFYAALRLFRNIEARRPGDGPSCALAARCEDLLAHTPSADWDGVFVQTEK